MCVKHIVVIFLTFSQFEFFSYLSSKYWMLPTQYPNSERIGFVDTIACFSSVMRLVIRRNFGKLWINYWINHFVCHINTESNANINTIAMEIFFAFFHFVICPF